MAINFEGTEVNKVVYDGVEIDKVIFNGVEVYQSGPVWTPIYCNLAAKAPMPGYTFGVETLGVVSVYNQDNRVGCVVPAGAIRCKDGSTNTTATTPLSIAELGDLYYADGYLFYGTDADGTNMGGLDVKSAPGVDPVIVPTYDDPIAADEKSFYMGFCVRTPGRETIDPGNGNFQDGIIVYIFKSIIADPAGSAGYASLSSGGAPGMEGVIMPISLVDNVLLPTNVDPNLSQEDRGIVMMLYANI